MPKLRVFVICESVIYDDESKIASLISLFSTLQVGIAGEVPSNAAMPKNWAIFTAWDAEPEDGGKDFVQCTRILWPDGSNFVTRKEHKFSFESDKPHHQYRLRLNGFPMGQEGPYEVVVWLEMDGKTVVQPKSVTMHVIHKRVKENENQESESASPTT